MLAIGSIMLPSFASHPDSHQEHMNHNPCQDTKPVDGTLTDADGTVAGVVTDYFKNTACMKDSVTQTLELPARRRRPA